MWLVELLMNKFGAESQRQRRAAAFRRLEEWNYDPDRRPRTPVVVEFRRRAS